MVLFIHLYYISVGMSVHTYMKIFILEGFKMYSSVFIHISLIWIIFLQLNFYFKSL